MDRRIEPLLIHLPDERLRIPEDPADAVRLWLELDSVPEDLKAPIRSALGPDAARDPAAAYRAAAPEVQTELRAQTGTLLGFGTAGLRGILGHGFGRMNRWTVATTAQAIAEVLRAAYPPDAFTAGPVVIGYDTRHGAEDFGGIIAGVLAANGIDCYLTQGHVPTPIVAYATKALGSVLGLMVTASHNPREYSGIKVYEEGGIQMGEALAEAVSRRRGDSFRRPEPDSERIRPLPADVERDYLDGLVARYPAIGVEGDLRIVYTSMHGTGARLVLPLLERMGFGDVVPVAEQIVVDPDFGTAPAPNPELEPAMRRARATAETVGADLVLATDPDSDRLAVLLPDDRGAYVQLTGNELGGLLTDLYIQDLRARGELPADAALVVTVVTDDFGATVARAQDVRVVRSLTGFKNICGKIKQFEAAGTPTYIMGYEESIGYALGTRVLDKDGISALALLASVAAREKAAGRTLWQRLEALQSRLGTYRSRPVSVALTGPDGTAKKDRIMQTFRDAPGPELPFDPADGPVPTLVLKEDYLTGRRVRYTDAGGTVQAASEAIDELRSDVLIFRFDDGGWFALRPSGTEPKLKFYFYGHHRDPKAAEALAARLEGMARAVMDGR